MKIITIHFLTLALILSWGCQIEVDVEAEKESVKVVLDSYVNSIEKEDMKLYEQNIYKDSAVVNFGGFGNPIIGWDALKEVIEGQNDALSGTTITVSNLVVNISKSGEFAWATCLWNLKAVMNDEPLELPLRCSWILEKQKNNWIIVHFHKSISAG